MTTGFRSVGRERFCFAPLSVFSDAHDPFELARWGRLGLPDNYQWTLSTTANQSYAGGTTTGWSEATGSGSASGNAVNSGGGTWNSQSLSSAGNSVTSTTSCGSDSTNQTDSYNATANWTEDVAADGSLTYNATVTNNVSGSESCRLQAQSNWQTTYSYPGGGNMPGMSYSTSGSSSCDSAMPPQSYSQPVDYMGYYWGRYTSPAQFPPMLGGGQGYGGVPVGRTMSSGPTAPGMATVTTPGASLVPAADPWTPPGGGAGSAALAGGPWYPANLSANSGPGIVVLSVDYSAMLGQGAGGEASFAEICASIDQPPPAPSFVDAVMAAPGAVLNWLESVPDGVSHALNWAWNDGLDDASNLFSGFADAMAPGLFARYRDAIGAGSFVDRNSAMYTAGQVAGTVESIALGAANPCGAGALASIGIKAVNGIQAVGNAWNFSDNLQAGNYGSAAMDAVGLLGNVSQMLRACFAAGTPLLTPDGWKPIEAFREGDLLLSASEDDPAAPIEPRRVEEIFTRVSAVLELRVCGHLIKTTAEHPFYVQGKGWTAAAELAPGDLFRSHDGRWNPVDSINPTGEVATVYNMRIAEYHTYFVGSAEWGFSVWAHNANYAKTYNDAYPQYAGQVVVHHAVPQAVMGRFTGLFTSAQMHALSNLRGIPKAINSTLHLSTINRLWNRFYQMYPTATRADIERFAALIDRWFGNQFLPPI
ncbi:MAG: polymorphic toxin-type HINT domain-containing protein [Thermoguttaceae bacterium]